MVPLILIGAAVPDPALVFGHSSFVVGFVLMAVGVVSLMAVRPPPWLCCSRSRV
ncbi:hypothetical protein [Streptomyces sp. NPDC001076]